MTYDEETVKHTEAHGRNREEIHRGDGFPMISKEDQPTFGWLGIPRSCSSNGRSSSGKIKPQHEELTVDARRAPGWILSNHPEDQLPNLLRCLFSPSLRPNFRNQLPIQAESGPVPPDDRFRVTDNEVSASSRTKFAEQLPRRAYRRDRRIGPGRRRFNTVSCCRSARFSRTRCPRLRNTPASAPDKRTSRLNMARSYTRIVYGHTSKLLILLTGLSFGEGQR